MARGLTVRRGEATVGAGLVLLAAYVVWEGARMPAGTVALPGAGFFPVALGALLGLAGLGVLVRALQRPDRDVEPVALGHRQIAVALLALAGVALLLERLGFLATASVFLLVLFRSTAGIGWARAALAAVAVSVAAYVFFDTVLGVPLPSGFR